MNISFKGVEGIRGDQIYTSKVKLDLLRIELNDKRTKDLSKMKKLTSRYPRTEGFSEFGFEHSRRDGKDKFFINGHAFKKDAEDIKLLIKITNLLSKTLDKMSFNKRYDMDLATSLESRLKTFVVGSNIKDYCEKILSEILKH